MNGFTLYSLDNATPIRSFVTDPPLVPLPKQVAFGEDSRLVVGGSDNGSIYLFERRSGQLQTKLLHSKDGLVQTITVRVHAQSIELTKTDHRYVTWVVVALSRVHLLLKVEEKLLFGCGLTTTMPQLERRWERPKRLLDGFRSRGSYYSCSLLGSLCPCKQDHLAYGRCIIFF